MLVLQYESKKQLAEAIGQVLKYEETSIFGAEYAPNSIVYGSNEPTITGYKRQFYAKVIIKNGLIERVE